MHRDIKNSNIFINFPNKNYISKSFLTSCNLIQNQVQIKLGDFGFSRFYSDDVEVKTQCGTPLNMAPEILNGKPYSFKCDMWSFGVAFFEAATGIPPFIGNDKNDLKKNVNLGIVKMDSQI
jgi:serine/threonine-protein kinase ULK/ATG1